MSAIQTAIKMLAVAAENDDIDRADYVSAAEGLQRLWAEALAHDNRLNQDEVSPTGDDYNDLFETVTA